MTQQAAPTAPSESETLDDAAMAKKTADTWEAQYQEDADDPKAAEAEAKINGAFVQLKYVTIIEAPKCRKALCRLVIRAASQDDIERALHRLAGMPYLNFPGGKPLLHEGIAIPWRETAADGTQTARLYIIRDPNFVPRNPK